MATLADKLKKDVNTLERQYAIDVKKQQRGEIGMVALGLSLAKLKQARFLLKENKECTT